jgi:hypothetical protein
MGEPRDSSQDRIDRGRAADEPLRGLAAPGPSKVATEAAMRARDVSRAGVAARQGARPQGSRSQGSRSHSVGGAGSSGSSPVDS